MLWEAIRPTIPIIYKITPGWVEEAGSKDE